MMMHPKDEDSIANSEDHDHDDSTVSSILSGLETRFLGLNTLGTT